MTLPLASLAFLCGLTCAHRFATGYWALFGFPLSSNLPPLLIEVAINWNETLASHTTYLGCKSSCDYELVDAVKVYWRIQEVNWVTSWQADSSPKQLATILMVAKCSRLTVQKEALGLSLNHLLNASTHSDCIHQLALITRVIASQASWFTYKNFHHKVICNPQVSFPSFLYLSIFLALSLHTHTLTFKPS